MADWQSGDLALCVSTHPDYAPHVYVGGQYIVEWVVNDTPHADDPDDLGVCLVFCDTPAMQDGSFYCASRFVKITPGHKIEGSEIDQRNPWKAPANV